MLNLTFKFIIASKWGLCEWSCDPVHIHRQSIALPFSRKRKCNALPMVAYGCRQGHMTTCMNPIACLTTLCDFLVCDFLDLDIG